MKHPIERTTSILFPTDDVFKQLPFFFQPKTSYIEILFRFTYFYRDSVSVYILLSRFPFGLRISIEILFRFTYFYRDSLSVYVLLSSLSYLLLMYLLILYNVSV